MFWDDQTDGGLKTILWKFNRGGKVESGEWHSNNRIQKITRCMLIFNIKAYIKLAHHRGIEAKRYRQ